MEGSHEVALCRYPWTRSSDQPNVGDIAAFMPTNAATSFRQEPSTDMQAVPRPQPSRDGTSVPATPGSARAQPRGYVA